MRDSSKGKTLTEVLYVIVIMLTIGSFFRGIFVNEDRAIDALENAGYSEITITDKAWLMIPFRGGDRSDAVRFEASAKNHMGKHTTTYVFVGWPFKGATIRSL